LRSIFSGVNDNRGEGGATHKTGVDHTKARTARGLATRKTQRFTYYLRLGISNSTSTFHFCNEGTRRDDQPAMARLIVATATKT
jgi:hypothetical protein